MENPLPSDAKSILSRVCGEPSSKLEIIPIVGMGGIGKTTLARYVYNHSLIRYKFDIPSWVTISQSYDLCEILRGLLRSINVTDKTSKELFRKGEYKKLDEASLKEKVYKILIRRRYLMVMDDMWHTEAWDALRHVFPDERTGSRIIITTREFNVASYVVDSLSHPHQMRLMSTDQSWELLREKVFGQKNNICPPELEQIGKLIAMKCRGLPLAIVVIAGVLSKLDRMHDSWEKIAEKVSEVVNTSGEQFSSDILSVSYMHLPQHLRPCFLYMGCFPEDYEINVSELIRLWMGEEFVTPNDESKDMEELGYEYLEDLARRSLVLIEKKRHDGKIKTVKIHDVLRDLCLRKCEDDNFLNIISEFQLQGSAHSHRLSIFSDAWDRIPSMKCAPIDSVLCFWHGESDDNPRNFWNYFKNFRLVRVLEALTVIFPCYPAEVNELINLRYLAFTYESYDRTVELQIPESLSMLQNLQTIVIRRLWKRQFTALLPSSVWRMQMLRHIILLNGFLPEPDPCDTLPLLNLHALSRIQNFTCSKRILEMLPNLEKLGIFYSYDGTCERGWSEYGLNNLVHLLRLEKLSFYADPGLNLKNEDVSKYIAFPATLRKLTLSCCKFLWEDMTIVGSLPNLEVLKLKRDACLGTVWETTENEFCQLKRLLIDSSTDLQQWIVESKSHFPKLERLTLFECDALEAFPPEIGEIPTLQLIEVDDRNKALVKSAQGILQEQAENYGNYELKVSHLKSRSWAW